MEKKIERVPYISKWYKEELDWSQLFKFDFKDEPTTEETAKELNNCFKNTHVYLNKDVWNSTITINPTLKYVCNLTQYDIDSLIERINHARNTIIYTIRKTKNQHDIDKALTDINTDLNDIVDYLENNDDVRERTQEWQLKILEEQSKPKKSYEGTLGEHWKELMDLFDIKSKYGINSIKDIDKNCLIAFQDDWDSTNKLHNVFNKLGLDFIKDFIKACEKCED